MYPPAENFAEIIKNSQEVCQAYGEKTDRIYSVEPSTRSFLVYFFFQGKRSECEFHFYQDELVLVIARCFHLRADREGSGSPFALPAKVNLSGSSPSKELQTDGSGVAVEFQMLDVSRCSSHCSGSWLIRAALSICADLGFSWAALTDEARIAASVKGVQQKTPLLLLRAFQGRPPWYASFGFCHPREEEISRLAGELRQTSLTRLGYRLKSPLGPYMANLWNFDPASYFDMLEALERHPETRDKMESIRLLNREAYWVRDLRCGIFAKL